MSRINKKKFNKRFKIFNQNLAIYYLNRKIIYNRLIGRFILIKSIISREFQKISDYRFNFFLL